MSFNLEKLLRDVFAPRNGERVLVMVDVPHGSMKDDADWQERRVMAEEWRLGFAKLGAATAPLLSYPATGASNADMPSSLQAAIEQANIVVAMTRYSATAPLSAFVKRMPGLRVASMPNVLRRMQDSALAADYSVVGPRTHVLADRITRADSAETVFTTGHKFIFDLRHRTGHADDGLCTPDKQGFRLINLPSGEAFIVPYEGEKPGDPSRTQGTIPLSRHNESMLLHVEKNRIVRVEGEGPQTALFRAFLDADPARRNVAELGLGCNDKAVVTGNVLEDEKAGFHWAYGRSEHLGGVTGPEAFKSPANVVHHDVVYAPGCPIGIRSLTLQYPDGTSEVIMKDGKYCIF